MAVHRLAPDEARRIAIGAQMLDANRPGTLLEVVERLTFLQIDPTAAIAPSADLVAWSRLGDAYRPDDLRRALEQDRTLFELNAMVRPMSDLRLYLADMAAPRGAGSMGWVERNDRFRGDVLDLLRERGPLLKPAAKRRWGYFALPILHHDRLVGKLDATADRKAAVLRVNAIHEDVRFTRAIRDAVYAEIKALAAWLGLRVER